jgi:hypothetical protein
MIIVSYRDPGGLPPPPHPKYLKQLQIPVNFSKHPSNFNRCIGYGTFVKPFQEVVFTGELGCKAPYHRLNCDPAYGTTHTY